jgi:hypothetical protein
MQARNTEEATYAWALTRMRFHVTIVAVEKQEVLHILSVFL